MVFKFLGWGLGSRVWDYELGICKYHYPMWPAIPNNLNKVLG